MGCASSSSSSSSGGSCRRREMKKANRAGLQLMTSKLHFQAEQLRKLDEYFKELAGRDREASADIARVEATVERLVQRLVVQVGGLDRRFSAAFLVSLNERRRIKQSRFEYLLRLDALSRPSGSQPGLDEELALSLEEDSGLPGFARLRLRSVEAGSWAEFLGTDGRLRRDLVKARVAALLARATRKGASEDADERLCATPGQVVDAEVLDKILKQPDHCRIFYGPSAGDPEPKLEDYRVAIVEDESGIILKIGREGSPVKSQDIQVRLLIGASLDSWPTRADYPTRVPLYHCDALLHYTAAQSGMYVVAEAPHQGLRCDDRASLWRIRLPAAETIITQHYCDESVPALIESALLYVLDQLRARLPADFSLKRKGTLRLVSRHIVRAIHWWSLERAGPDPLKNWAADSLARHVLLGLDELLRALKCQNLRCYFQPRCNLMLQCARGGLIQNEDLYSADARLLESYLVAVHAYSSEWLAGPERKLTSSELLEDELLARWRQIRASLMPRADVAAVLGEHCSDYSPRQLQYLGLVVREVLRAKDSLLQGNADVWSCFFNLASATDAQSSESIENLVYLMSLVLRQAKDEVEVSSQSRRMTEKRRSRRRYRRRQRRQRRTRSSARAYFDRSVDVLIDIVRKDRDTAYLDLENHTVMAQALFKWLHYGMEEDKKVLGALLRPYLAALSSSAQEHAWHVESWRRREDMYSAEMRSLGLFCKLVAAREVMPAKGLVDALSRGWAWAEGIARTIEASGDAGLKLIFLTPERILRYQIKFAEEANKGGAGSFSTWRSIGRNALSRASLARTSLITATDTLPGLRAKSPAANKAAAAAAEAAVAGHVELRDASPLTRVARTARRRGRQRGPGGLIPALVTLNKFRVLQEAAQVLPQQHERTAMLELVQQASRGAARCHRRRRRSCPDQLDNNNADANNSNNSEPRQLYTPKSESALYETASSSAGRDSSPQTRQRRIILERQLQLRREISEIHDTLTRGLRSRSQLPSWDSMSMASSTGSIGHGKLKRHRITLWGDTARAGGGGGHPSSLWDSVSCNSTFSRIKPDDKFDGLRSHERLLLGGKASPELGKKLSARRPLPSWEILEKALSDKFSTLDRSGPNFQEDNARDVDYMIVGNDTKEFARL